MFTWAARKNYTLNIFITLNWYKIDTFCNNFSMHSFIYLGMPILLYVVHNLVSLNDVQMKRHYLYHESLSSHRHYSFWHDFYTMYSDLKVTFVCLLWLTMIYLRYSKTFFVCQYLEWLCFVGHSFVSILDILKGNWISIHSCSWQKQQVCAKVFKMNAD